MFQQNETLICVLADFDVFVPETQTNLRGFHSIDAKKKCLGLFLQNKLLIFRALIFVSHQIKIKEEQLQHRYTQS